MTSVAARMRAHRQREASGYAVVQVNVKLVPVTEFLIESELLDVSHAEDRRAIGHAPLLIAVRSLPPACDG